jgi:tetratricopeptide (TPR) repeat protein
MTELQQLIQRGKKSFEAHDYAAALSALQEALHINPNFADVHHLTGLCLGFTGHAEAALQAFNAAIELNPRFIEAHINRAIILTELGRFDEAQQAFVEAARFETGSEGEFPAAISARLANAHKQLGDLYLEAGAAEEAAKQYGAALVMRPNFHDIRNRLAQALLQLNDLDGAIKELQAVLTVNPRFLAARLNLGWVYFRSGDREAASREWEIAVQQQPTNPQVRAYQAMLNKAGPELSNSQ